MKLRSGKNLANKLYSHNPIYKSQIDYEKKLKINFKKWKTHINNKILFHHNMGCDDIPDLPYYDYFVEGIPVQQIVDYIKKEFFFY